MLLQVSSKSLWVICTRFWPINFFTRPTQHFCNISKKRGFKSTFFRLIFNFQLKRKFHFFTKVQKVFGITWQGPWVCCEHNRSSFWCLRRSTSRNYRKINNPHLGVFSKKSEKTLKGKKKYVGNFCRACSQSKSISTVAACICRKICGANFFYETVKVKHLEKMDIFTIGRNAASAKFGKSYLESVEDNRSVTGPFRTSRQGVLKYPTGRQ